jgi:hypothetical protein
MDALHPARLQPQAQAVLLAEGAEAGEVCGAQGGEVAQHQHRSAIATIVTNGHLDLGDAIAHRQTADQLGQGLQPLTERFAGEATPA